ncbi:MAG: peroxidase [Planctomycetota bacterium]|nr:peroxidase [Planctomycetota bacterium]
MAWIEPLSEEQDESGILKKIYAGSRSRTGEVAQIIQVMSPRPDLLEPFLELYVRLMHGTSGLTRAEREWVAVLTSQYNDCHY